MGGVKSYIHVMLYQNLSINCDKMGPCTAQKQSNANLLNEPWKTALHEIENMF